MPVSFRRSARAVAVLSVALVALASCGSDTTTVAKATTTSKASSTDQSTGATTKSSGPTAKVRIINVWSSAPGGSAIDIYQDSGVGNYSKIVTGLAYGAATDELDLKVSGGGANLQVTKPGEQPDKSKNVNNVQMNSVDAGQHGVLIIGWNASAGADGTGGTSSSGYNLGTDDVVKPVDGKVKVHVTLAGADANENVMLAVVGKGCLGDDGLNEPTVEFDPGQIQIQGVKAETSQPNCQGDLAAQPVSVDGAASSSWIVALYGSAGSQKLAAFNVTPG